MPTLAASGVPDSRPVSVSKLAHAGRLAMLKTNGSPFASLASGANEYVEPATTAVGGVPEMTGATLLGAIALIENRRDRLVLVPSLTVMRMLVQDPDAVGVPLSTPVVVAKIAHEGLFWIE
jgi:hypothetical protein